MLKITITDDKMIIDGHCEKAVCYAVSILASSYCSYHKIKIDGGENVGYTVIHEYNDYIASTLWAISDRFPKEIEFINNSSH